MTDYLPALEDLDSYLKLHGLGREGLTLKVYFDVENCPIPRQGNPQIVMKSVKEKCEQLMKWKFKDVKFFVVTGQSGFTKVTKFAEFENVELICMDNKNKVKQVADVKLSDLMAVDSDPPKHDTVYVLISGDTDFTPDLLVMKFDNKLIIGLCYKTNDWSWHRYDKAKTIQMATFSFSYEERLQYLDSGPGTQNKKTLDSEETPPEEQEADLSNIDARLKNAKGNVYIPSDTSSTVVSELDLCINMKDNQLHSSDESKHGLQNGMPISEEDDKYEISSDVILDQRGALLLNLNSCPVPTGKNGVKLMYRILEGYFPDYKINNIQKTVFFSGTEIPDVGLPFCFLVNLRYCPDIKVTMENVVKKCIEENRIQRLVIIDRDASNLEIKPMGTLEICRIPNVDDLTRDLPNDFDTNDPEKQVQVMDLSDCECFEIKKELKEKFSKFKGFIMLVSKIAYFETKNGAGNCIESMHGLKIGSIAIHLKLRTKKKSNKKAEDEHNETVNDSSPKETDVPPVADACYQENFGILLRGTPPADALAEGVSSSQCESTDDCRTLLHHKLMDHEPEQSSLDEQDTAECRKSRLSESGMPLLKRSPSQETQTEAENNNLIIDGQLEQLASAGKGRSN